MMTVTQVDLQPKLQVTYVPNHADGPDHPDSEDGFITSVKRSEDGTVRVFCRFWSNFHDGLRTTTCSECCFPEQLVIRDTHPQDEVDALVEDIWEKGYNDSTT